jgi:hypothetical protein
LPGSPVEKTLKTPPRMPDGSLQQAWGMRQEARVSDVTWTDTEARTLFLKGGFLDGIRSGEARYSEAGGEAPAIH